MTTPAKSLSLPLLTTQLRQFLNLFYSLPRPSKLTLLLYFGITLFLKLIEETLVYFSGKQTSKVYSTLTDLNKRNEFYMVLAIGFGLVLSIALVKSFSKFWQNRWVLQLRKALSIKIIDKYLKKINFLKLTNSEGIDNPDQRLTEELDLYCEKLVNLITNLLTLPILIIYYTYKTINLTGYSGVSVIFIWFLLGSTISYVLIYKVSKILRKVEKEKSNYRKYHIELVQNSNLIQTYNSYNFHKLELLKKFLILINTQFNLIFNNYLLLINLNLMDYTGSILTYTMISVPILLGYHDDKNASELSALISLNTFQCMYLIYQLTTLLHQSETLSEWLGHSVRLNELVVQGLGNKLADSEEFDIDSDSNDDEDSRIELEQNLRLLSESQNDEELPIKINFVNVDLINYKNEFVLQDFNFELNSGENLIIRGVNGIGKSSLCKLITNVIKPTNGHIIRQNLNLPLDMMYFSQKLMIIEGNLIDQICYPNTPDYYHDSGFNLNEEEDIKRLLKLVNLTEKQFKIEQYKQSLNYQDWCNNYSLGTLTKLNLIRIFLLKPKLIVLDEITSSLDLESEQELILNLQKFNIQFALVSHKGNFEDLAINNVKVLDL